MARRTIMAARIITATVTATAIATAIATGTAMRRQVRAVPVAPRGSSACIVQSGLLAAVVK